jgi:glycosyltransferase involved in cell wall biosynthesis
LEAKDKVVLLVAGLDRAHYFKGVDVFLSALSWLPPYVKGIIVGDGDLRGDYEVNARLMGVGARVHFAGRVPAAALPAYYRLADVTVLPSTTMGEAFGLVLVESLASATPVVASNLPGVRTVVATGTDGLLVDPGDSVALAGAVGAVLRYEAQRQIMGQAGRAKMEQRYDWRQIGRRLEALYCHVLAENAALPLLALRQPSYVYAHREHGTHHAHPPFRKQESA